MSNVALKYSYDAEESKFSEGITTQTIHDAISEFNQHGWLTGHTSKLKKPNYAIEILKPNEHPKALYKDTMAITGFYYKDEWLFFSYYGANSQARFQSQHYNPNSSGSNLAKHLLKNPIPNIKKLDENSVGDWIKDNCYRVNIFIPASNDKKILKELIEFLRIKFPPYYGIYNKFRYADEIYRWSKLKKIILETPEKLTPFERRIYKTKKANPDLPYHFIKSLLSKDDDKTNSGDLTPYEFG